MSWLNEFKLIVRSSVTSLREKVEDPERMIHQLIIDMEEELERVKRSVAEAIADEIQLGQRVETVREEVRTWHERARRALGDGEESSAQGALERRVSVEQRAEALESEHAEQKLQTAKLQRAVEDLEEKIRQARQRRTLLLARMTRASSSTRIHQAVDRAQGTSAFAEFHRLEEKVERAEARSAAYDRLAGRDPVADELAEAFERRETEERVRTEMESLRDSLADPEDGP